MIDGLPRGLAVVAAIGAGLSAGVFFTFSTFVMRALTRMPDTKGMVAMQAINREAPTAPFMSVFLGTGAVSVTTTIVAIAEWSDPWAPYLLVGSALYLAAIVLTVAYHVPRNDALDHIDAAAPEAEASWRHYASVWIAGNHVRTLLCAASALAFVLALGNT